MALPVAIGRYEIVARLATGGMAEILLARIRGPESFERPLVIKRILSHIATRDVEKMFLEEARIAAGIRHPNVVQVHELGSEQGELYLAMEYLEGETASSLVRRLTLRKDKLGYALAAHIAAEICAGLHAAHDLVGADKQALHLVHRDVSPQNLFITYDGDVKLLDFGIAKTVASSAKTEAGTVKGKIAYMSPEQCHGAVLDRRSDLFSLGTVLYELITGRQLFQRASAMLTMRAISDERVVPLTVLDPEIPTRLSDICMKALEPEVADRYATATEMRRDLLALQRSLETDGDLREELGRLMRELYADRIEAKERMLQQVRGGQAPDRVPEGEADIDVEIPIAVDATVREQDILSQRTHAGTAIDRARPSSVPARRRTWGLAVPLGLVMLAAVGAVSFVRFKGTTASRPAPVASNVEPQATAPSATPEPVPSAAAQTSSIGVNLSSVPIGATVVVDGERRGTTPTTLKLTKSGTPVHVELVLAGYAPLKQEIIPDVDQRLVLSLTPSYMKRSKGVTATSSSPAVTPHSEPSAPAEPPVVAPAASSAPRKFTRFN